MSLKVLKSGYRPTPWLFNCHLQTLWGLKLRGRTNISTRREDIIFSDGGQVSVDWFEKNVKEDAPILFIIHTLGGGAREPCTNFLAAHMMKKGYRVMICACRGCNGSKITSKRLYNGYQTDDLHHLITHASSQFPKSKNKFLVGFSLGSMIAAQYAVDFDDVDVVVCVSHSCETDKAMEVLDRPIQKKLYYPTMMKSLHRCIEKSPFYTKEEKEKIMKTKNLTEFDNLVTAKNLGLSGGATEYYKLIRLNDKIDNFKCSVIILNAEDDPFTDSSFLPLEKAKNSMNCAFITLPEGGHVSFSEGLMGKTSFVESLVGELCEKIRNEGKQ